MKQIVTCLYKPKTGQEQKFEALMTEHFPLLHSLGLVAPTPPYYGKSADGTYFEVFEWADETAPKRAHESVEVQSLWESMCEIAETPAFKDLSEGQKPFAHFASLKLDAQKHVPENMQDTMISAKNFDALVGFYKSFGSFGIAEATSYCCTLRDSLSGGSICITDGESVKSTALGFRASDLAESLKKLEKLGGKVVKRWEYESMVGANAADPEGNEIMVWQMKDRTIQGS